MQLKTNFVENFSISNSQCSIFSKKNAIIWTFCISECLTVPFTPDNLSSTVLIKIEVK